MTGNHVRKVQALLKDKSITTKDLTRLNIYHDETCNLLQHRGPCDCDPVIEIEKPRRITGAKLNRE